jgi:transcriptional regulator of met regulon
MAKAIMAGQTEAGVPVLDRTNELPTANAYLACESTVKAIAAGEPVPEADAAFREVPPAKPRASKKTKREDGDDGDSAKRVCGPE